MVRVHVAVPGSRESLLAAEYTDIDFERACAELPRAGFSLILKDRQLSAWQEACRPEQ